MGECERILAIDGGATKTEAALLAPDGTILARARTGPCNLYRDIEAGIAAVAAAWDACCAGAGLDPPAAAARTCLSAGMAGLSAPGAAARFRAAFARFGNTRLSGDGTIALLGAFEGGPGALISIGTGVIGSRLGTDGRLRHASGWGFPIGDAGGGAWLGFSLIGLWLEHLDGYASADPATPLWAEARRRLGTDQAAILAWLRTALPQDYAALAPVIVQAAQDGDGVGRRLLDRAAAHLVRLARALEPGPDVRLALSGGLAAALAGRIVDAIGADRMALDAVPDPLRGAWLLGVGRAAAEYPRESDA